jgi:hypothetical protein
MVEHWVLDEEAKDYHLKLDVINDWFLKEIDQADNQDLR